jgi:WD40 repeat protein
MSAEQRPGVSPPPEPSREGAGYVVEIQGPGQVGEGNTQIIASYNTYHNVYQGTWTDGVAPTPLADGAGVMRESPYRGLAAFREQDAGFFFGRVESAGQVLERMSQHLGRPGPLMLSGVSGAGKSSLLQAGALPRIRESGLGGAPEARNWPCLVLTPGREPLAGLASVATLAGIDAATTHQALKADPADFALTARQAAEFQTAGNSPTDQAAVGRGRRLLLIVDQLEQLFIQCPDEEQRAAFLAALHAAATARHGADDWPAALVILVVRADFEARCAEYPLLAEAVQDRYLVTAMTERQLRMAITEPAKKAGSRVDDDLVTVLLGDIRGRASGMAALERGPGMTSPAGILPLLSHALDAAWRARAGSSLTVADYESAGGIERAVAESADRAYARLTSAQQAAARTMFLRLTATGPDGTLTVGRATRAELLHGKNAAQARDIDAVLEAFVKERLLTLSADTVEISHEILLRAWPLLRDKWLAGTQADRIIRTRLLAAASEWDRSGRDPSYLYAGTLLRDAAHTVARADRTRQSEPSALEEEFLNTSNRARRRSATVRRRAIAVVLSLAIGLAAVAFVAYYAAQDAARQGDAAFADQLLTESEAQAVTNPTASKIESLAAWQMDPTPQSRYALVSAAVQPMPDPLADYAGPVYDLAYSVAFSRDGRMMATIDDDGTVKLWNTGTQQQIGRPLIIADAGADVATSVDFSPNGKTIAVGELNGVVQLWNTATHQQIGRPLIIQNGGGPCPVAFSPDGRTLAGGGGGTVRLWNVATQQEIGQPITVSNGSTDVVAFSPDGRTLAIGINEGMVLLVNLATRQEVGQPITVSTAGGFSHVDVMAFSPDGQTIATGDDDNKVRLWNVATQQEIGQPLSVSTVSYPGYYTAVFNPDGRTLAIGLQDGTDSLWSVATQQQAIYPLTIGDAEIQPVVFSPDGQTLATGGPHATEQLWNVGTRQPSGKPLTISNVGISAAAFSLGGRTLATGTLDGTVQLWNVLTRQPMGQPLTVGSGGFFVDSLAFSPNGRTLAVVGNEGMSTQLWNVATRQPIGHPLTIGDDEVSSVTFSPGSRTLATIDFNGTVRLWNVATQQEIGKPITGDSADNNFSINAVAFSPDGQTLATGDDYGMVQLWNVATQQQISEPLTYVTGNVAVTGDISALAFSPDGQTLASGDKNGAVRLWNVATQQQIGQPLAAGNSGVIALTFRPGGRTLAAASADGIRLWDVVPVADPLAQVCNQVTEAIATNDWEQYLPPGPSYSLPCP